MFTPEHDLCRAPVRLDRDARVWAIGGTSAIMEEIIAKRLGL